MCGLVAIFAPHGGLAPEPVHTALARLAHRGPDGEGVTISADRRYALGHRRLSIIDHERGAQPLKLPGRSLWAAINGELYGFESVRATLEAQGQRFETQSDSEVILALYGRYGLDFVQHLRGEYAIAIVDGERDRLVLARDPFGVKPLFIATRSDGGLVAASEAKALFALGISRRFDVASLSCALSFQYLAPGRSLFAGIEMLAPGHVLTIERGEARQYLAHPRSIAEREQEQPVVSGDRPLAPGAPARTGASDAQWIKCLADSLEDAVAVRLRADVPVALHLSGGLDSSSIAAIAAKHLGAPVPCFVVAFDGSPQEGVQIRPEHASALAHYDERELAAATAEHLGAQLEVVRADAKRLALAFPTAIERSEGIAINAHLPAKLLLAQSIRAAGYPVCLSGEGADELLLGYPHFRQDLLLHGGHTDQIKTLLADNPASAGLMLAQGDELPVKIVQDALGFVPSWIRAKASMGARMCALWRDEIAADAARSTTASWTDQALHAWFEALSPAGHRWPHGAVTGGRAAASPSHHGVEDTVETAAWLWSRLALSGYILRTLGDGTEMAAGVEGRVPFLDTRVAKICAEMPVYLKIRDGVEKWALRQAMRDRLPSRVIERRKHPFVAPPLPFLEDKSTKELLFDTWSDPSTAAIPVLDRTKVLTLLARLPSMVPEERKLFDPVLTATLCVAQLYQRLELT